MGVSRVDARVRIDAPGHVVGIRRPCEPLRARVLAVRGIGWPVFVVAGHRIRAQLQQRARNLGIGVGPRCVQGRVAIGVSGGQIRTGSQQRDNDGGMAAFRRSMVQRRLASQVACVDVRPHLHENREDRGVSTRPAHRRVEGCRPAVVAGVHVHPSPCQQLDDPDIPAFRRPVQEGSASEPRVAHVRIRPRFQQQRHHGGVRVRQDDAPGRRVQSARRTRIPRCRQDPPQEEFSDTVTRAVAPALFAASTSAPASSSSATIVESCARTAWCRGPSPSAFRTLTSQPDSMHPATVPASATPANARMLQFSQCMGPAARALVIAHRGIRPQLQQLHDDIGVLVRQGRVQGRVALGVAGIRIGSGRNEGGDYVRLPTRGRNRVERGPAIPVPCVRVRAGFEAARHLVNGGIPEEVRRRPTLAADLAGGGRRAEQEDGCGRNERPICNP